jgi:hypothetical protein
MQLCTCDIRLGGEIGMQVHREGVTVAEIMVLRAIHGQDSVFNIVGTAGERRNAIEERERLTQKYTARTEDGKPVVMAIFPGAMPQLPKSLKEIGEDDGDVPAIKGRKSKAQALVAAVAGAGPGDEDDDGEEPASPD